MSLFRSLFFVTLLSITATRQLCAMNVESPDSKESKDAHPNTTLVRQQRIDLDKFLKNEKFDQFVHKHGLSIAAFDANNPNSPFAQSLQEILDFLIGPKTTQQTDAERQLRMLNWLDSCQTTALFNNKHRLKLFRQYWGDNDMWEFSPSLPSAQNPHPITHFKPKINLQELNDLLLLAAESETYQAIKILIATLQQLHIPLTSITDTNGNTTLHLACKKQDIKMFHLLNSADSKLASLQNQDQKYPINLLTMRNKFRVANTATKIKLLTPAFICLLGLLCGISIFHKYIAYTNLPDIARIIGYFSSTIIASLLIIYEDMGVNDTYFQGDGGKVYTLTMPLGVITTSAIFFMGLAIAVYVESII